MPLIPEMKLKSSSIYTSHPLSQALLYMEHIKSRIGSYRELGKIIHKMHVKICRDSAHIVTAGEGGGGGGGSCRIDAR